MRTFQVKNFEQFQHYRDRSPPWIKLYNRLLDDYDFCSLPDASKMHLIAIWLLASRSENKIPYDSVWIAKKISATSEVDLTILEERGFIVPDQACSNPLANGYHDASKMLDQRREEREGEREKEPVLRTDADASQSRIIPNGKGHDNEQEPRHRTSMEKPGNDSERNSKSLTPSELRSEFWRGAVAYLVQYVKGEQATRSVIGKWCKAHGTGAVIDAIAQAQTRGTPDPVAYIVATLKKTSSNGNGHAPPKKTLGHDYGSREWWREVQKAGAGYLSDDEYRQFEAQYGRAT